MTIPDWQLPPGVDRGLWDYFHADAMVRDYDEKLAGTPLLESDIRFAEKHFAKSGKLIDLGCGTGRLLLHFAQKGFDCLGVDLSEAMLAVAAQKSISRGLPVRCQRANLVELDSIEPASFDYAACLFSTLGMIRGEDNRGKFLKYVHRILKPRGVFVLHVHNRGFRFGFGLGKKGKEKGDRTMPQAYGGAELTLHHFTQREIVRDLRTAGFVIREIQPVSTGGELKMKLWWPAVRAYGYLLAAAPVLPSPPLRGRGQGEGAA